MKIIKKPSYLLFDKHFIILTILTLGLVIGVSVMNQRTQTQQMASQVKNLNTSSEIETVVNPDGTMGPDSTDANFSGTLPSAYLGSLIVNIQDSQAAGDSRRLKLSISKIEAHLIHLFIPGDDSSSQKDIVLSNQKTNQNVNKWETLLLNGKSTPITINFAQGSTNSLGSTSLAGGKYSEIRLYISKAVLVQPDGKEVDLSIPGSNNIIRLVSTFNIYAGKTTTLTLDLDQKSSVVNEGEVNFLLPFVAGISLGN